MGREARLNAATWRPVTNADVTSSADPDCKRCGGTGFDVARREIVVCPCAPPRFYREYAGRLRRGPNGMEMKPLVSLVALGAA